MSKAFPVVTRNDANAEKVRLGRVAQRQLGAEAQTLLAWGRRVALVGQYEAALPEAREDLERLEAGAETARKGLARAEKAVQAEQEKLRDLRAKYRDLPGATGHPMTGSTWNGEEEVWRDNPDVAERLVAKSAARDMVRAMEKQQERIDQATVARQKIRERASFVEIRLRDARERVTALERVAANLTAWARPETPAIQELMGLLGVSDDGHGKAP